MREDTIPKIVINYKCKQSTKHYNEEELWVIVLLQSAVSLVAGEER
jgi:hypothetical protein